MSTVEQTKNAIKTLKFKPISTQVAEVRQNINLIQEAMKATMIKDVHFGVIPGCQKPSLYKPGAEVIIALFKLSTDPIVTDLSKDGEIRYQVKVNITNREGGFIGSGVGECSSGEEKYSWRIAVCEEEFSITPETHRRIKFKKYQDKVSQVQQVRVSPSDMANTILKMAKKRALIDAVLTATGASDIFSQDIEDLPEGYVPPEANTEAKQTTEISPQARVESTETTGDLISDPQAKRFYAIARGAGINEVSAWLLDNFGIDSSKKITKADYERICKAAEQHKGENK